MGEPDLMRTAAAEGTAAIVTTFWGRAALYRKLARIPITRAWARRRLSRLCASSKHSMVFPSTLAGLPVDLDLSDGTDRDIYLLGRSDARGVAVLEQVMERLKCGTAWDIGTNRGNHAAFMRLHCRELYCFEPNPVEYNRARALLTMAANVSVLNIGLSSVIGKLPFFIDSNASGSSSFELEGRQPNFGADVSTGDDISTKYAMKDIDFIKIDVEGHEHSVLLGMRNLIAQNRPVIIMEILSENNRPDINLREILEDYEFFGNCTGLLSGITKSAYTFCRFQYGVTYMSGMFIPREKTNRLALLLPD